MLEVEGVREVEFDPDWMDKEEFGLDWTGVDARLRLLLRLRLGLLRELEGPGKLNLNSVPSSSSSSFPNRSSCLSPLCPTIVFETRTVDVELDEAIRSKEGGVRWLGFVVVVLDRERVRVGLGLVGVVRLDEDGGEEESI